MTTYNAQPPSNVPQSGAEYVTDTDEGVRKRREAGLSDRRETAPAVVQRPPDAEPRVGPWLLVSCLAILVVSIIALVYTRTMDPAKLWGALVVTVNPGQAQGQTAVASQGQTASTMQPPFVVVPPGYSLWLAEDFTGPAAYIPSYAVPNQFAGAVLPDQGVYRLDIWPGQIGWTLFDVATLPAYRFETSATIDPQTPVTAVGLLGRFQSAGNFYLFTVDGDGRVAVELWKDGAQFTLQPPTSVAIVNPLGKPNRLALEDDGQQLRFFVNQVLLFTVADPQLPAGRAGVTAVSTSDQIGAAMFDWVAIYTKQ